jgi:putative hydrolase of the HAD superfamily
MPPLDLWIDADDTLWENNIFFERVFTRFVNYLNHATLDEAGVRDVLDDIEHVNNRIHGYGAGNFVRNLGQCMRQLTGRELTAGDQEVLGGFEHDLKNHPMELIEGVDETLAYLNRRHQLLLCTKGNPAEQQAKFERSGLAGHFHHVRIVREKDVDCYLGILNERGREAGHCWMVGNSPKSDIHPPLQAGIGAVYVPHPNTWHLEHMEIPEEHERLKVVDRFTQLRDLF